MNGKMTWNVTGLTTVTAGVHRNFEGTNLAGASQIDATGGDIRIDHELLYSLLLSAGGSYEVNEFVEETRDDTDWDGFLAFTYFLNRQLSFRGVLFARRSANVFDRFGRTRLSCLRFLSHLRSLRSLR